MNTVNNNNSLVLLLWLVIKWLMKLIKGIFLNYLMPKYEVKIFSVFRYITKPMWPNDYEIQSRYEI